MRTNLLHLHTDHRTVKVIVAIQLIVLLYFRFAVWRAGKETGKDSKPAADIAPTITAAGGKLLGLHDFPHIGVIGDGQAKKVGLLHVVGFVLILLVFKMVQVHGVPSPQGNRVRHPPPHR